VRLLIEGQTLPPIRSVLASPSDGTGTGTPQQVLKPETRPGSGGYPEGSPSPA
jgi:cell division protease FtsH